jgi:hypothetical protein
MKSYFILPKRFQFHKPNKLFLALAGYVFAMKIPRLAAIRPLTSWAILSVILAIQIPRLAAISPLNSRPILSVQQAIKTPQLGVILICRASRFNIYHNFSILEKQKWQ